MDHVAIDLGGRKSQICIRRPNNDVHLERRVPTAKLKVFFKTFEPSSVILESAPGPSPSPATSGVRRRLLTMEPTPTRMLTYDRAALGRLSRNWCAT
jgi:hypothetical protein